MSRKAAVELRPTSSDLAIARLLAHRVTPGIERAANIATWAADGRVMCTIALACWLAATGNAFRRPHARHLAIGMLAASLLPHLIKRVVRRERPDRWVKRAPWRGIPQSGRAYDSFPSGHAVHLGLAASALSCWPNFHGPGVWVAGAMVASSRVLLLAHWASDVIAGLAIGIVVERVLRRFETALGFPPKSDGPLPP